MTEPVERPRVKRENTLGRQAETVLRDMILTGEIAPGERLNEVGLASALGISRGPLREAIQRLVSEGILTMRTHRGTFVRTFERAEIIDLYELRMALELHAIRILGRKTSADELVKLAELLNETQSVMTAGESHSYPAHMDFHLQMVSLAANPAITARAIETDRQLALARSISAKRPVRAKQAIAEHQAVVESLRSGDTASAMDLMERHIQHGLHSALAALGLDAASVELAVNE